MKNQNEAIYWDFFFSASADKISEIENYLRTKKSVIRFIIIKRKDSKLKKKIDKKNINFKMIDKIEPIFEEKQKKERIKENKGFFENKEQDSKKEKTKIEDLDKKLEEILNQ